MSCTMGQRFLTVYECLVLFRSLAVSFYTNFSELGTAKQPFTPVSVSAWYNIYRRILELMGNR